MNNKSFGILLKVINVLSIVTLEKYWKNGFKFVFKKTAVDTEDVAYTHRMVPAQVIASGKLVRQ